MIGNDSSDTSVHLIWEGIQDFSYESGNISIILTFRRRLGRLHYLLRRGLTLLTLEDADLVDRRSNGCLDQRGLVPQADSINQLQVHGAAFQLIRPRLQLDRHLRRYLGGKRHVFFSPSSDCWPNLRPSFNLCMIYYLHV